MMVFVVVHEDPGAGAADSIEGVFSSWELAEAYCEAQVGFVRGEHGIWNMDDDDSSFLIIIEEEMK